MSSVAALRFVSASSSPATGISLATMLTVARAPLGACIIALVMSGSWSWAASAVLVFACWDVADGVIERRTKGIETASRRALDGIIDKASVHGTAFAVTLTMPSVLPIWTVLVVRDITQGLIAGAFLSRGVVLRGASWHRAYSVSLGVWGCSILLTHEMGLLMSLVTMTLGLATIADFLRQIESQRSNLIAQPTKAVPSGRR